MTGPQQLTFTTLGGDTVTVKPRGKHYVQPRGYARPPGTGPAGETCGTCSSCDRQGQGHSKRWAKCLKARFKWTGGRGSDILTGSAACELWEPAA